MEEIELEPEPQESSLVKAETNINERFVEESAKQVELRSKLLAIALKALKAHDIQNFDGKPYIEGEGAERIMAVVRGFKVSEPKFIIEQIGNHYFVECQLPVEFMGATTVSLGDCSTADPFFTGKDGKSGQYARHLARTGSDAMACRLILGDAKKKAMMNATSRAVTELLGLKGLSWDDLGKLGFSQAGAQAAGAVKVEFKKGSQGGATGTYTVAQAADAPVGAQFDLKGPLLSAELKTTSGGKKYILYTLGNLERKVKITVWGETIAAADGQEVFCKSVKISENKGYKNYNADEVTAAEEAPEPGSNG